MLDIQNLRKHHNWLPVLVASFIGISYFVFSVINHDTPYINAYSEFGYVTKAAAIAGASLDGASSWYGGYSFILSPVFFIFSDPGLILKAIQAINSLLWAGSALLLWHTLRAIFPSTSQVYLTLATIISFTYMGYFGYAGHVFAINAFVFVFIAAMFALLKSELLKNNWLIVYSILIGLLTWIHPTGIAVAAVSLLVFTLIAIKNKSAMPLLLIALVPLVLMFIYSKGIHPLLNDLLTPDGIAATEGHYSNVTEQLLPSIGDVNFWIHVITRVFGQLAALAVATYGIVAYAIPYIWRRHPKEKSSNKNKRPLALKIVNFWSLSSRDAPTLIITISILSVVSIAIIGSLSLTLAKYQSSYRADMWIYLRYVESVAIVLIGAGALSVWRLRTALYVGVSAILISLLIALVANTDNTIFEDFATGNTMAFWPQTLTKNVLYVPWFMVGAIAIGLFAWLSHQKLRWLVVLIYIPILLALTASQVSYWSQLAPKKTTIADAIRAHTKPGTCVRYINRGSIEQQEMFKSFNLQLHDYDYRRIEEPLSKQKGCIYIGAYAPRLKSIPGVRIVAMQVSTHLYIAASEDVSLPHIVSSNYPNLIVPLSAND